jgi:hypothetical protein
VEAVEESSLGAAPANDGEEFDRDGLSLQRTLIASGDEKKGKKLDNEKTLKGRLVASRNRSRIFFSKSGGKGGRRES